MAHPDTFLQKAADKWDSIRTVVMALIFGLVAGPALTNIMGWQTITGTAEAAFHDRLIEQHAKFCEVMTRANVAEPGKLGFEERVELAKKWAALPGDVPVDSEVALACANRLAV